jgi:DeoR/GlpR family transcriptional regulator of sugar metabolism
MTRPTGPALNELEWRIFHHIPHRGSTRVKALVWLTAEHPDTIRRVLRELEQLGYVTHNGGGVWRRVATLGEPRT